MAKSLSGWYWHLGLASLSAMSGALADLKEASAQITPDSTLPNNSIVTPQGNTSIIEGGTQAGSNLFHSFDGFSVPTGGEAYFNNGADVQNIFNRVTGGSVSNIDGLLRANGTANLFLLNPNGIIFGPNASLNIGGSFVGSTASSLNFADGTSFSATAHSTTPLLTISAPIGLQYGGTAGSIINQSRATNSSGQSVGLQVQPGTTLALLGGRVSLDGGNVRAPGGRVELGGLAVAGTVGLNVDGNNPQLSFPDGVARADVSLTNGSEVNVRSGGGGSIAINAQNLNLERTSILRAGIASGLGSIGSVAGDIEINATGAINLTDGSFISNAVLTRAVGNGGNVNITASSLSLTGGTQVNATTSGQGDAGSVNISASDTVSFDGGLALSRVESGAVGNAGNVNITASSLSLTGGAQVSANTRGQGNAGSVNISASDTVSFDGVGSNGLSSAAGSIVETAGAVGNGGDINIATGSLFVINGAQLLSGTRGRGNAGSVNINARNTVSFDGVGSNEFSSGAISTVESGAVGNSGDINITTGSLAVTNGGVLAASTGGQGDAGSVTISASDTVSFDGVGSNGFSSRALSTVASGAVGNGGDINIATGSLAVTNGAALIASTIGQGDAGNVTITASDTVSFDEVGSNGFSSGAYSTVESGAVGNGGDINIATGSLALTNGATLTASTYGQGDAGNVFVQTDDSVSLLDNSFITGAVAPGGVGNGGDIDIQTRALIVTNGSQVGSTVYRQRGDFPGGQGRGGNIQVNASDSVTLSGTGSTGFSSGLVAATERGAVGPAGNITVNTGNFRVADGAVVLASSFNSGDGGDISINTKTFEAVNGGQAITNTRNSGNAGNITLNATDSITLSGSDPNFAARLTRIEQGLQSSGATDRVSDVVGNEGPASGLFANATANSTGQGGSLRIETGRLNVRDKAEVNVSSAGAGPAGDLTVEAGSIRLDNGSIGATTTAGQGNINLRSGDLVLRRGSNITTNARGTAEGGNITIDSDVIAAIENSDISANSQNALGGRVRINTSGIFGTQFRNQQTPLSDITATGGSPELSGSVEINRLDVDPTQGLVTLPAEIVDASNQIAQACPSGVREGKSKFIVTGRAGLPPDPISPLTGEHILTNLATLDTEIENISSAEAGDINPPKVSAKTTLVEATGWMVNDKGKVVLTASVPSAINIPWLPSSKCNAPSSS